MNNDNYNDEVSISMEDSLGNEGRHSNETSHEDGNFYNNWNSTNAETVRKWKASVSKSSFIYDVILEKYKRVVDKTLVWAFIIGTISTILAAISSAILAVDDTLVWMSVGFNSTIFILNGIVTILNGRIKIYKWNELVNQLTSHVEKLDHFYAEISSELVLPDKLRKDAIEFIQKQDSDYLNIIRQTPNVYPSDYKDANKEYLRFLKDNSVNYKYAQKYNADDSVIDIV